MFVGAEALGRRKNARIARVRGSPKQSIVLGVRAIGILAYFGAIVVYRNHKKKSAPKKCTFLL